MNILVTGKNGQLGSEINELSTKSKHNFIFLGSDKCDISDIKSLELIVQEFNINAIINCAAYTAVDNAEDEVKKAYLVNETGVKNINTVAIEHSLKYIHISTDYVFNGTAKIPYIETDKVNPIGIYGNSKRKGEEIVINSISDAIVIRTSWLYSSFGNNFVKTMIRLGSDRDELNVVSDQFGSPTYAKDLAAACIHILETKDEISQNGRVYHFANHGTTSWSKFAEEIFDAKNISCKVNHITTDEYPTKAERPKYSVLCADKIEKDFGVNNYYWKESLGICLSKIQ